MMIKYILTLLFTITFLVIFAQQPTYRIYTTADGLHDNRIYAIGYADDGIYLSYASGKIEFFNGIDFVEKPSPNPHKSFSKIQKLEKGFMMYFDTECYYYSKDGFITKLDRPLLGSANKFLNNRYVFKDGLYELDEEKGKFRLIKRFSQKTIEQLSSLKGGHYSSCFIANIISKNEKNPIFDNFKKYRNDCKLNNLSMGEIWGSNIDVDLKNEILKWDYCNDIDFKTFNKSEQIKHCKLLNQNNSKLSFMARGHKEVHFFTVDTSCTFSYEGKIEVPRINIIKQNSQKNVFLNTYNGLYKINPNISFFTQEHDGLNTPLYSVLSHQNKIWTMGYGGGISVIDNKQHIKSKNKIIPKDGSKINLPGGFSLSNEESWIFTENAFKSLVQIKNGQIKYFQPIINGSISDRSGFYIDTLHDGRLAFGLAQNNFGILDSITDDKAYIHNISKSKGVDLFNVLTFVQDKKDRIWMGRPSTGIAVYDIQKDTARTFSYTFDNPKSFGMMSCLVDSLDQLWLGTNQGLYLLPQVSQFDIFEDDLFSKAVKVPLPNGESSIINAIKMVKDQIVVGSKKSISLIPIQPYPRGVQNIAIHQEIFGEDINGDGVVQNAMYLDQKNMLWVAVQGGLLKIDIDELKLDTTSLDIVVSTIKSSGKKLKINDSRVKLDSDKRNITIGFRPRSNPSMRNNIYYSYLVASSSGDTIIEENNAQKSEISIPYLSPDKYDLTIRGYKNGLLKDEKKFTIDVPYALGENPWFWVGIMTLLGGGFIYFYIKRNKQKHLITKTSLKLSQLQNEQEKLKVQAIINTFNPHFINNSLHWLQSRYYKDKDLTTMIGRLSSNILYIFNKTKTGHAIHTLKEEIKLVENYIMIQSLRFRDSFEYTIHNKALLEKYKDLPIIIMQLQIHVENAIEHGLRNRKGSSFIDIGIKEDDDYIIISITDDGIGRKASRKVGSQGTQMGTKMLKDLYEIFNSQNNRGHNLKCIYEDDIYQEKGIYFGTKVNIYLPKLYDYKL